MYAKSFVERIGETRGNSSYGREHEICRSYGLYSESFNRQRALRYFRNVPVSFIWRGEYSFTVSGIKNDVHFTPETIADFISICQSLGKELIINLGEEETETDRLDNMRLKIFS